eukprot:GHRR01013616.1.p1 GENE.GHRR01013616.1~~GHRR01013616.1.p1  ORF type:complete len:215 (+),score=63.37 GHRR01013616.1:127-771(+)
MLGVSIASANPCGRDFAAAAVKAFPSSRPVRLPLVVLSQQRRKGWQTYWGRCTSAYQQLAASQSQWPDVKSSLSIGIGVGALACGGGSGTNGPSSNGNGGSGGDGWSAGPGHNHSPSNVLSDVASVNDAGDAVEDVILLDVGGMKCGGCVGHVKNLLEQHGSVLHATVNLATETALVRVRVAAGNNVNKLAAELAQALTAAGFKSHISKKTATR